MSIQSIYYYKTTISFFNLYHNEFENTFRSQKNNRSNNGRNRHKTYTIPAGKSKQLVINFI